MNFTNRLIILSIYLFFNVLDLTAQFTTITNQVPPVYTGIMKDIKGVYYHLSVTSNDTSWQNITNSYLTPHHLMIYPTGYSDGLNFDFNATDFYGTLYYSVVPDEIDDFLFPVYTKSSRVIAGKAQIYLKSYVNLSLNDTTKALKVLYRLSDQYGQLLYDGSVRIENQLPITPLLTIVEGPFVNNLDDKSALISFITDHRCSASVVIDGREFNTLTKIANGGGEAVHEIQVNGLLPETCYTYKVRYGIFTEDFEFTTAPLSGSRKPFTIAFSSNSRGVSGGGEWDLGGINAKCLKGALALASMEDVAFFQFSGNLIKGYNTDADVAAQQYHNWKKAVELFGHCKPIYTAMGDHDVVNMEFLDGSKYGLAVDNFPFASISSEAVFARHFINPDNGPVSEDLASLDPYTDKPDFPIYNKNVYSYKYDNLAVIVLNSCYWSTPSNKAVRQIGGNPPGYIMDNQLQWVKATVFQFEKDQNIDHIVVVLNSPLFPTVSNTGMWYHGNNLVRPVIAADPVAKGILERRDELLNILANQSEKVALIMTSSDYGYARMEITPQTTLYNENYRGKKLKINRPLWQISCGLLPGSGFKNEIYPWSAHIKKSTHQSAVAFVYIDGEHLSVKALNPILPEEVESVVLK